MVLNLSIPENLHTLDTEELTIVRTNNTVKNQLLFAIMLKFFQINLRYPSSKEIIEPTLIYSLAAQLNITHVLFEPRYLETRTAARFREKIRNYLGYKIASLSDAETLIIWLIGQAKSGPYTLPQYREKVYQYLNEHKLERFTADRTDRYIRSAIDKFEKHFFAGITKQLSPSVIKLFKKLSLDKLENDDSEPLVNTEITLRRVKSDLAVVKLKHVTFEIKKLSLVRSAEISYSLFNGVSRKVIQKYYQRIMAATPSNILEFTDKARFASMACFFYIRSQLLTDNLADLLIKLIRNLKKSAEIHVNKKILTEVHKVNGKFDILCILASTSLNNPKGIIEDEIYPKVSKEKLEHIINEGNHTGSRWYQSQVNTKVSSLYSHAHRNILLKLLDTFSFHSNTTEGRAFLTAIEFIKQNRNIEGSYYPDTKAVPIADVIPTEWKALVIEPEILPPDPIGAKDKMTSSKIKRFNYEVAVLEGFREKLRCKTIWIDGAYRYRNPDDDLPLDWETNKEEYYSKLGLPLNALDFIEELKTMLHTNLQNLNDTIPANKKVQVLDKNGGHIKIAPSEAQAEPVYLDTLQREINRNWSTINLIDILKETDLRINFTKQFHSVGNREILGGDILQKRLLLCLYALGSNTGLKRVSAANDDASHSDLSYVKRRFINEDNVRAATVDVINEIIAIRDPEIWGEATTGCACDSTLVSSWDQNLMSEWHPRYKSRGIMIYWHIDLKSLVIHSQIKTCLSSEVGAMITGVLRHDTKMNMNKTYVDTHGESTVGYAFSYGLDFDLLARIKGVHQEKLYYPSAKHKSSYPNLEHILNSPIRWKLIEENYDEYVKHIAALKFGTVDADTLIKKFSKENYKSPIYKTLIEIGKAVKTTFLCRYLSSEGLRIEIHESLNVVERLNGIMGFIFYGKLGEISTNNNKEQALAVACLHLLQVSMVYINTLIIQEILSDPACGNKLTPEDKRALTPLIHAHINPYGLFPLDLQKRIIIEKLMKELENDRTEAYAS